MMARSARAWLACLMVVTFAACDEEPAAGADAGADAAVSEPTWHQQIAPIVMRACASCHVEGGVAPFALDSYATVSVMAPVALSAIEGGRMPPWMPDPDCREFEDERLLTADEKAVFQAWVAAGAPEGDPTTAAPIEVPSPETFEPTHMARPIESYQPDGSTSDDYRCFVLDLEFDREMFVTASEVVPDAGAIVHHVLVYALNPGQAVEALDADAESAVPGYPCYGSPLPGGTGNIIDAGARGVPNQIASWVPGAVPDSFPTDHAIPIQPGSRVVMQVHYNLQSATSEPDATTLLLRMSETPPLFEMVMRPLMVRTLVIPAGEPAARNAARFEHYGTEPVVLLGVGPHMHGLGRSLSSVVERADGTDECLLDVPEWLFSWQQLFSIPREQWVVIEPGDAITLECVYDNSAANQPFDGGVQQAPRDVGWGDGTRDEMCMLYLSMSRPYVPAEVLDTACHPEVGECIAGCAVDGRSTADCLIACGRRSECTFCALGEAPGCGGAGCGAALLALRDDPCLQLCFINATMLGGDASACLRDECPEKYGAVTECLGAVLDTGDCDAAIADTCGLVLP
jgi:hypothetical protein